MATSVYLKVLEQLAHIKRTNLTKQQELEILAAYKNAGNMLIKRIEKADKYSKPLLTQYAHEIYTETLNIVKHYGLESAMSEMDYQKLFILQSLSDAKFVERTFDKKLNDFVAVKGQNVFKKVLNGKIYSDNKTLSERIWKHSRTAASKMDEIIQAALAQGMSAAELSEYLVDFVDPSKRVYWNEQKISEHLGRHYGAKYLNLEYNSLRLARTTISHVATLAVKQRKQINPFADKVEWHSVHAPGRTCSICKDMDGNIYKVEEVPFDHPNGLCYLTTFFDKSMDEMADVLAEWVNNPSSQPDIESWYQTIIKS